LGLRPGTVLLVQQQDNGIVLKPPDQSTPLKVKDGVLVFTGEAQEDITDVVRKQREERARTLTGMNGDADGDEWAVKYLFDSSLMVAALVEAHPHHHRAFPWLSRMCAGELEAALTSHSLAEVYAALTVLPVRPRISPSLAWRLIRESASKAKIVPLTASDYRRTIERVAELGLSGGVIYDALIACAAEKLAVDGLVTFNVNDFRRAWPEGHDRIIAP
jgi:predicted nucleic acid-binding protein